MNKNILPFVFALGALTLSADVTFIDAPEGFGKMGYHECPLSGQVRYPVILVEFEDTQFSQDNETTVEHFNNFFNCEGWDENGATGSVRDFFIASSFGNYTPSFDIYGPVKLANKRSYYGNNSDKYAYKMIVESVRMLQEEVDFSQYDIDGDDQIDDVIVIFAGNAEYTGGGTSSLVPTSFLVSFSTYYDTDYNPRGVQVGDKWLNAYTYTSETAESKLDGIGTFCHEFSHGLGLADVYSPSNTSATYTPMTYDLMDIGIYNNNSNTPPTMNAFERFALGWMQLELITEPCQITLEHLEKSNLAYAIKVSDNEYFIFENRQQAGWDKYIPWHGMLVWHIDYIESYWYNNYVNYYKEHQCIDLVEANGKTGKTATVQKGYPFPGTSNITSITPETKPALKAWYGAEIPWYITDITESEDGIITAKVSDNNQNGVQLTRVDATDYFSIQGRKIQSNDNAQIDIYDLNGRAIVKAIQSHTLNPGMYVVTVKGASALINVR